MRPVISTIFCLWALLFSTNIFAQAAIKAEVDKTSITTDEQLIYKLVITSSEKNIPSPVVPKFEGFYVVSQARSSTVSFLKEGARSILVYSFILMPKSAGDFTIEPSKIKIGPKTYASDVFKITVTQCPAKPQQTPEQQPSAPREGVPESNEPQITL